MIRNLKIRSKLLIAFVIITVFASISGVIASYFIMIIDEEYSNLLEHYGFGQGDVGKAMLSLTRANANIVNIINLDDEDEILAQRAMFEQNIKSYTEEYSVAVSSSASSDEEKEYINKVNESYDSWYSAVVELFELEASNTNNKSEDARKLLYGSITPAFEELYSCYDAMFTNMIGTGTQKSSDLSDMEEFLLYVVAAVLVSSIIVAIILGFCISKAISAPIADCTDRLVKLSQGDLTSPIKEYKSNDEIGKLNSATTNILKSNRAIIEDLSYGLGEMANGNFRIQSKYQEYFAGDYLPISDAMYKIIFDLSEILQQINQVSDQVNTGSEHLSLGAQSLAQGTTEQASAIDELAATIVEISQKISATAENSKNAKEYNSVAQENLINSNHQMQEMMVAMEQITEKSNEISKIIKVIDEIAFQTNILALNAAVEASRAGDAGKGFAVVADEVRNLAAKSARSAKDTELLIAETMVVISNGNRIATSTSQSIENIFESAKELSLLVDNIADDSQEQSIAASQINIGVEQIAAVVQMNSSTAEESAAASEELAAQAHMLKELVNKFKLVSSDDLSV